MEAYIEPLYSDDLGFEIYFREAALERHKIEHSIMCDVDMYLEADENGEEKMGIIASIADKIKKFIQNIAHRVGQFFQAVKNSFGGSDGKLTIDMYLDSGVGQMQLNGDINKITKEIEDEILQERKGVQMLAGAVRKISSATNLPFDQILDDRKIGQIVDKVNKFVVEDGATVVKAGIAVVAGNALSKAIKDATGITEELNELTDKMEKDRKDIHNIKMQQYKDNKMYCMKWIERLTYATDTTINRAMKYYNAVTRPLNKFNNEFNKFSAKKKK